MKVNDAGGGYASLPILTRHRIPRGVQQIQRTPQEIEVFEQQLNLLF